MTDEYARQRPLPQPVADPTAARVHWAHSVIEERDFVPEWRALEVGTDLAREFGFSQISVDAFALPLRHKQVCHKVRFNSEVEVLLGMEDDLHFQSLSVAHDSLFQWPDKPWTVPAQPASVSQPEEKDLDSFSLMARRPIPISHASTSSSASTQSSSRCSPTSSSTSSDEDDTEWQQTVLILLDGRMFPARLPWREGRTFDGIIAQTIGISREELYGTHHVCFRPHDFIQVGLQCLLVQRISELRPSPFLKMVLIDLEIYEQNEILPGAFRRFSRWLPQTLNRVSTFRMLDLEPLLDAHHDRCFLWHNNIVVPQRQRAPLHLDDGDYIKVLIGQPPEMSTCGASSSSSFQVETGDENATDFVSSLQHPVKDFYYSRISRVADADPLSNSAVCISSDKLHQPGIVRQLSMNQPFSFFEGPPQQVSSSSLPGRPPGVELPVWYQEIWDLLNEMGATEMEEEGPIIYVDSHFVSHVHHPHCFVSRPLRFDVEFDSWESSIRFMWEDLFDNEVGFELFLVRPQPPRMVYHGTVATVLIVQHPMPEKAAGVVTVLDEAQPALLLRQSAHSFDLMVSQSTICSNIGVMELCAQRQASGADPCQFRQDHRLMPRDVDLQIRNGIGLQLILHRPGQVATPRLAPAEAGIEPREPDDHDEVQLFSFSTPLPPLSLRLLPDAEMPPSIQPIPAVLAPAPLAIDIGDFEELDEAWTAHSSVFATTEEEASVHFVTWYVNGVQWFSCDTPRDLILPRASTTWPTLIQRLWSDRLIPGFAARVTIIHPPVEPASGGGHLLIHQQVDRECRGILASAYWHQDATLLWHRKAMILPFQTTIRTLQQHFGLEEQCLRQVLLCLGFHGRIPLPEQERFFLHAGAHLELHVSEWADIDETELFQTSSTVLQRLRPRLSGLDIPGADHECSRFDAFTPSAASTPPAPFARIEVDEFARQLFTLWDQRASSWEEEARSCIVRVWFVDHGGAQPHGLAPRDVRIYMPVWSWRTHIWQIWADQVIPGVALDYFLVEPFPPTSDIQVAAHVLLVQRAVPNWLTSIVTCRDFSTEPESFHQFAVTTLNPIPFEVFLQVFGLHDLCFGVLPSRECQVWLRDELLRPGVPVQGIMGLSFEIQVRLRDSVVAPAEAVEAPVLLQLSQHLTRAPVAVADQEAESFDLLSPQARTCSAVRLVGLGTLMGQLPTYVTVEGEPTSITVGDELRAFGIEAQCVISATGTLALAFSGPWPLSADHLLVLFTDSSITIPDEAASFIHQVEMGDYSELDFMVMLYKFGIEKAVILHTTYCLPGLLEVVFVHSEGKLAEMESIKRPLKPWPPRVQSEQRDGPFWSPQDDYVLPDCLLDLDLQMEDLSQLFHSSMGTLCTSLDGLDLPEVTSTAVQSLSLRTQFDRLVIYMDGSSQSRHKHHSPAFNEDFDIPDSWSFVVLGETFINETESDLSLVGWCAHQVRCDPDHPWFVGATHLSSAIAEREALFWALLWRIGYNSTTPTIFRSDSMLAIGQASGTLGPSVCDLSFKMLRGSSQLLQSAIGEGFHLDHVYGHAGDPWNELVDMLAKQEARSSFYLKRPALDIPHLRGKLPFLWMLFDIDHGTPGFSGQGFDVQPPSLPSSTAPTAEPPPRSTPCVFDFGLSIASANVLSMYNSENGFGGKLDYLRTQFIASKLNLMGIQEARTPEGLSLKHGVLRLCSGSLQGQGGVELWVHLSQPYAYRGRKAILFQKRDFHVAHRDFRRLIGSHPE